MLFFWNETMSKLVKYSINALSDEELARVAKEELGEDDEELDKNVKTLKDWINSNSHLRNIKQEELYLKYFLRGCNYNLENTKERLDFFNSVKSCLPSWFDNWDPTQEKVQEILEAGIFLPLKGYDKHGRTVILVRNGVSNPTTMNIDDLYRTSLMLMELSMEGDNQPQFKGYVLLNDFEGITFSHTLMTSPAIAKKHCIVLEQAYPMDNVKQIAASSLLFINMPKLMQSVFSMYLSFQKEEFKNMNQIISREDSMKIVEALGSDILPVEYGGTNESVDQHITFWKDQMNINKDWLHQQTKYKTDETKRKGKPKVAADIFGSNCVIQ